MTTVEWIAAGIVFAAGLILGTLLAKKRMLGGRQLQFAEAKLQFHRMARTVGSKIFAACCASPASCARTALGRLRI